MHDHRKLFIGGEWLSPPRPEERLVFSPANEERIGVYPLAHREDVDAAVAAARRALSSPDWVALAPDDRATLIRRLASELHDNASQRSALTSTQNGMPITISTHAEGAGPVALLRYYADLVCKIPAEERRPRIDGAGHTLVVREPVGVVAVIVPWNFPQALTMFKIAPALAAGCTVVLKPAPETSLDALELAAAAERAGIPPGVLNVITGGADIGSYLVEHPDVNKVSFTGSTAAGRAIGQACGRLLRPVTLELGGKSAAIILDDADTVNTVRGLATSSLLNTGQTCYLSTRILVPRQRHDELLEAIAALARALPIGDPLDPTTMIGPLVSRQQRDRVDSYIEQGKNSGATLAAGGGHPDRERGWFVEPTVFGNVSNTDSIAREEVFGPVLAVIPYDDVDDAVAIANDSDYGLGGTIWTRDVERGIGVARRVHSGTVGVNFYDLDIGAPFGGIKASGLGHELGPEGLEPYVQLKSIYLR